MNYFNPKLTRYVVISILICLVFIFLTQLILSLDWRVRGDSVYLHYVAYLINEHDFLPYKDLFEINLPATYLFHMAIGRLFGYSEFVLRFVNMVWLAATLMVTSVIMRPFGRASALASCMLFGIIYLGGGPYISLQREFISMLPISIALLLVTQKKNNHSTNVTHFIIGALFSIVALIKPPLIIGFPAIVAYNCFIDINDNMVLRKKIQHCFYGVFFALSGFILTLVIPFLWLWRIGVLEDFIDIFTNYLPLYAQMSGNLKFQEEYLNIEFMMSRIIVIKKLGVLFLASAFGVYFHLKNIPIKKNRKLSILLLLLSAQYIIYAVITKKMWDTYLLPYLYFSSLGAATLLTSTDCYVNKKRFGILAISVFFISSIIIIEYSFYQRVLINPKTKYEILAEERQDSMVAYFHENLSPNDKVQPLSWIGGTMEAMLNSEAILATPYIADLQFHHHVSTPYILKLREDFIKRLQRTKPKFIVDVRAGRWISGFDTDYNFPELEDLIQQHYIKDYKGKDFDIYTRLN